MWDEITWRQVPAWDQSVSGSSFSDDDGDEDDDEQSEDLLPILATPLPDMQVPLGPLGPGDWGYEEPLSSPAWSGQGWDQPDSLTLDNVATLNDDTDS